MSSDARRAARWDGPTTEDRQCRWYLARQGATQGPLSYEALLARARDGELHRSDHVWRAGFEGWIAVTARPDLVAPIPPRPELGVVPETLEAAAAMRTGEVRFTDDVVHSMPDPDHAEPSDPTLHAAEEAALQRLESRPGSVGPVSSPRTDAALRLTVELDTWSDSEASINPAQELAGTREVAETFQAPALEAEALDDIGEWADEEMARLRPSRARLFWGLAILLALAAGGAALLFGSATVPTGPAAPLAPEPGPAPQQEAPPEAPKAPPKSAVRLVHPKAELTRNARTTPDSKGLAWLNQAPEDREAAPDEEPAPRARPAPRNYRVAASADEVEEQPVEALSSLPERLGDDQVGATVASAVDDFGRCALHDRLSNHVPRGAELQIWVDGNGEVVRARVRRASGGVGRCLVRVARHLSFPRARTDTRLAVAFGGGGTVRPRVLD